MTDGATLLACVAFVAALAAGERAAPRLGALAALAFAFSLAVRARGPLVGALLVVVATTAAASALVLVLAPRPRWAGPVALGAAAIAGALAVAGALPS